MAMIYSAAEQLLTTEQYSHQDLLITELPHQDPVQDIQVLMQVQAVEEQEQAPKQAQAQVAADLHHLQLPIQIS